MQRARSAAKNSIEFVTLADRNLFSRSSIIVTCARPSLELYHEYNVNNQSAKESLKWYQDRAMDLGLPCINATIELLGDVGLLDKIGGIRSVNCPFTHLRFAEDHPVVAIENDKASEIGEYVVCLAIQQLRSCTWVAAIPGLFPRFTVGGEVAEPVMREFKQAYDDFKVVETKSGIFWRRVQGRSLWSSVHTQQIVASAEKGDTMVRHHTDEAHGRRSS